jgi:hypothetical protein
LLLILETRRSAGAVSLTTRTRPVPIATSRLALELRLPRTERLFTLLLLLPPRRWRAPPVVAALRDAEVFPLEAGASILARPARLLVAVATLLAATTTVEPTAEVVVAVVARAATFASGPIAPTASILPPGTSLELPLAAVVEAPVHDRVRKRAGEMRWLLCWPEQAMRRSERIAQAPPHLTGSSREP